MGPVQKNLGPISGIDHLTSRVETVSDHANALAYILGAVKLQMQHDGVDSPPDTVNKLLWQISVSPV